LGGRFGRVDGSLWPGKGGLRTTVKYGLVASEQDRKIGDSTNVIHPLCTRDGGNNDLFAEPTDRGIMAALFEDEVWLAHSGSRVHYVVARLPAETAASRLALASPMNAQVDDGPIVPLHGCPSSPRLKSGYWVMTTWLRGSPSVPPPSEFSGEASACANGA